jgi:hypothetical protein
MEVAMSETDFSGNNVAANETDDRTIQLLLNALRDLQFGQVTAIVQDGVVVQVERTEKRRLNRKPKSK